MEHENTRSNGKSMKNRGKQKIVEMRKTALSCRKNNFIKSNNIKDRT